MKKIIMAAGFLVIAQGAITPAMSLTVGSKTTASQMKSLLRGTTYVYNDKIGTLFLSKTREKDRKSREQKARDRLKTRKKIPKSRPLPRNFWGAIFVGAWIAIEWAGGKGYDYLFGDEALTEGFDLDDYGIPLGKVYYAVGYNVADGPLFRIGGNHWILKKVPGKAKGTGKGKNNHLVKFTPITAGKLEGKYTNYVIKGEKIKVSLNIASRVYASIGLGLEDRMPVRNAVNQTTNGLFSFLPGRVFALKSGFGKPGIDLIDGIVKQSFQHVEGHVGQILYLLKQKGKLLKTRYDVFINNKEGPCQHCRNEGDDNDTSIEGKGQAGKIIPNGIILNVKYKKPREGVWTDYGIEGHRQ